MARLLGLPDHRLWSHAERQDVVGNDLADIFKGLFFDLDHLKLDAIADDVEDGAGEANAPWLSGRLQPGGDIDAVAHHVASIDKDVAQVNAHPVNQPIPREQVLVLIANILLNGQGAGDGLDRAVKEEEEPVTRALYCLAAEGLAEHLHPFQIAIDQGKGVHFVFRGQCTETDGVCEDDGG
jgi:hypothetical protein